MHFSKIQNSLKMVPFKARKSACKPEGLLGFTATKWQKKKIHHTLAFKHACGSRNHKAINSNKFKPLGFSRTYQKACKYCFISWKSSAIIYYDFSTVYKGA
jgi:hypothetical protein